MGIALRSIKEDDLLLIMQWRMDPDITRYMNSNPTLTLEEQKKWLYYINANENVRYWLIEVDGKPVGLINLIDIDWERKNCSWGYYIGEKNARSLKLAISLEMSLYDYVFDVLDFKELHNEVFSLNAGVVKLHLACGSHIVKEVVSEVVKEGINYDITHISITSEEWNSIRLNKKYECIDYDIAFKTHHIGYVVSDIWNSVKKYRMLGYVQSSALFEDKDRNVLIIFMRNKTDGTLIELIAPMNDKSPISQISKLMKGIANPYHICYEVENMESSVKELKRRKFVPTTTLASAIAFDNRKVIFLVNKDVGLIELLQK